MKRPISCASLPPDASRCLQMPPDASQMLSQVPPDACVSHVCLQMPPDACVSPVSMRRSPRCLQMPPDAPRWLPDGLLDFARSTRLVPPDAPRCLQVPPDAPQSPCLTTGSHSGKTYGHKFVCLLFITCSSIACRRASPVCA